MPATLQDLQMDVILLPFSGGFDECSLPGLNTLGLFAPSGRVEHVQ